MSYTYLGGGALVARRKRREIALQVGEAVAHVAQTFHGVSTTPHRLALRSSKGLGVTLEGRVSDETRQHWIWFAQKIKGVIPVQC